MKWAEYSQADKDLVTSDFRNFVFMVWEFLGLPEPTPIQYDIAEYLQKSKRRTIIMAFRGVGKSWITSAYVCWLLLCNPQLKILVVSASKERADNFSTFTKRLISGMPLMQHLIPNNDQRNSNVSFDVAPATPDHAPSVKSVGISGQLAGSRADIIVADDVEIPNNSMTQLMRDRLGESVKEFDAILKPGGFIKYLGTPQTEMSLYNVLSERGYEQRIWTARYPRNKQRVSYDDKLAPYLIHKLSKDKKLTEGSHDRYGVPTDPKRFDSDDLIEREASYGRSGFALQFMLDTSVSDADRYPLKLSDLLIMGTSSTDAPIKVVWGSSPEQIINDLPNVGLSGDKLHRPMFISKDFSEYTGSVMWIDPSGRGTDETGYVVLKMINGFLYLRKVGGFLSGYDDETLKALAAIAKEEKVNYVGVEDNFGDGMFLELFKPYLTRAGHPVMLEGHNVHGMKEARIIDTLEPIMNQHRLVVDEDVIKRDLKAPDQKYQLFYQLTRISRDKGALVKDDRVDVLAQAVGYFTEQMARDVSTIEQEHRDKLLDDELRKFAESFGKKAAEPNWTNVI